MSSGGAVCLVVGLCAKWWRCVPSGGAVCQVVGLSAKWWRCVPSGGAVCHGIGELGGTRPVSIRFFYPPIGIKSVSQFQLGLDS